MQIYSIQSYMGRNVFSHRPVVKMVLDIGDYHSMATKDLGNFNERLLKLLPGLEKHFCSRGHEGGFVERLNQGTYMGHVIEHIILELQYEAGYEVYYGKTRLVGEPSLYYIVYEIKNEKCGKECGRAAVNIAEALAKGLEIDIKGIIEYIKHIAVESDLGPSTRAIVNEAVKRGIPVTRLGNESLVQLGYGKHSRLIEASLSDAPSCVAVDIAANKHLTKEILTTYNIPVPIGDMAYTEQSSVDIAREIGYPVVVKPFDGNQGRGVSLNLFCDDQVRAAFREAIKYSKSVIVERFIQGKDYRVLVVGDKVSAVSERTPPQVIGDGVHTVRELVEKENTNHLRGEDHEKPLTKIKLDEVALLVLKQQGAGPDYIPSPNECLRLRDNANLSTGGKARDCTDEIHPYNAEMAIKAAKLIGLDIAGVDIKAEDISIPIDGSNGAIVEINAVPGLRMHIYPSEGQPRNVASDIVDMMFPKGKPFTIPIVSITGTNGKTTTARLVRHILAMAGLKVGMTSTSGVYIGNECILKGDNTGPVSARMVLSSREVEAAVLETARGGIVRKGLGYDLADVGVITNISEDHIGIDNVNDLEDLAHVKSLVAEAVKPEGYVVLNADDRMIDYLIGRVKCNIILFSRERSNLLVARHIKDGGKAVYIDGRSIVLHDGIKPRPFIRVNDIPITMGGIAECNIENSLAALGALFALQVPAPIIKNGLLTFRPDPKTNPGRFNLFDMGSFTVMLDYGHNIAGYMAVIRSAKRMNAKRLVGVIGMPGDRSDENIRTVAEICADSFSKVYIKEDRDLRGRKPGEVAQIFLDTAIEKGMGKENAVVIHSEIKALETAILDGQPGDLIIMFYEEFEPAVELIEKFKSEISETMLVQQVVEKTAK